MLKIFAVVLVAGALFFGWYRNDLRKVTRGLRVQGTFRGAVAALHYPLPVDERGDGLPARRQ